MAQATQKAPAAAAGRVEQFLAEVSALRSEEHEREFAKGALLPVREQPRAVVAPADVRELQMVLAQANRFGTPLYPLSCGRNWGYGLGLPKGGSGVLLYLGRMNRIIELNRTLAYAVIEPGVTQQQLVEHLKEHAPELRLDVTGAPPDSSILGNLVERGYSVGRGGDRFGQSAGMEIVLADGTLLRTGFGRFSTARTAHLYKWGLGPFLDGLFTQSNLGVVARTGIWLLPRSEYRGMLLMTIDSEERLLAAIDRIRTLKLDGVLQESLHIYNGIRALSTLRQYPWELMNGRTPLSAPVEEKLLREEGFSRWNGVVLLDGRKSLVRATLRELRRELRGIAGIKFFPAPLISAARTVLERVPHPKARCLMRQLDTAKVFFGEPQIGPSRIAYWRKRCSIRDIAPLDDQCGLIWCSPVAPADSASADHLIRITREIVLRFGFELNVSLNFVSERAIDAVVSICFDNASAAERETAEACRSELIDEYRRAGFIPYRCSSQDAQLLEGDHDAFWNTFALLKQALDPNSVLAPERFQSAEHVSVYAGSKAQS